MTARDGERKAREQLAAVEYGRTIQVAYQEWRENNVAAALALLDRTRGDLERVIHQAQASEGLRVVGTSARNDILRMVIAFNIGLLAILLAGFVYRLRRRRLDQGRAG